MVPTVFPTVGSCVVQRVASWVGVWGSWYPWLWPCPCRTRCPLPGKVKVLVIQLCPILYDPMDCSPPGSSVRGIFQIKIREWVAISSSRGSTSSRDQTQISCIAGRFFTIWVTREAWTKDSELLWLSSILMRTRILEFRWRANDLAGWWKPEPTFFSKCIPFLHHLQDRKSSDFVLWGGSVGTGLKSW